MLFPSCLLSPMSPIGKDSMTKKVIRPTKGPRLHYRTSSSTSTGLPCGDSEDGSLGTSTVIPNEPVDLGAPPLAVLGPAAVTGRASDGPQAVTSTPLPWEGQRVRIEDLPDFKLRWGLVTVGSRWGAGEPCPTLYLVEG